MNFCRRPLLNQTAWIILAAFGLMVVVGPTARGADDSRGIGKILEDMKARGEQFDPAELIALGEDGLCKLLDVLMPESAGFKVLTKEETELLVKDLGDREDARRRNAMAKLISGGIYVRESIEAASASADPEVAVNARGAWKSKWETTCTEGRSRKKKRRINSLP